MDLSLYYLDLNTLEKKIQSDYKKGLNNSQIKEKVTKYGLNKLKKNNKTSILKIFLKQFNDFFIYILLTSSLITFFIGLYNNQKEELFESFLILIIVLGNALLSFFYEIKKEKSLLIVKKKIQNYVKVLRNNKFNLVLKSELVPGDIVFLEQGDIVPADSRIIESNNLKVNESFLTGESLIISKNNININTKINLLNANNVVFMETTIIQGYAKTVVIKTGMETQIGKINNLVLLSKTQKTPLEKNINNLAKILTFYIIIILFINLILNILRYYLLNNQINLLILQKFFLSSVVLAVAIIPEGLLSIINIILTLGIGKIAKKKAIIKNLKTLETLGSIDFLCTDKTGTLTQNKMTIKKIYLYSEKIEVNNKSLKNNELFLSNNKNFNLIKLIHYGILCNNDFIEKINKQTENKKNFLDPIDQSFIELANYYNFDIKKIQKENIKIKEFPFNDYHKFMATIHKKEKKYFLIMKGACEILLNLSFYIREEKNIFIKNDYHFNKIEKSLNMFSEEGYKVLTIAYTPLNDLNFLEENTSIEDILKIIENKIIFLGAVAIQDPIREEIFETIKDLKKAFITPIMITGDHLSTACQVAYKTGIIQNKTDLAVTGEILNSWSSEKLTEKINNIKVYARVTPEHKLKIIQNYQKKGYIVAMVGDGINDAPSIKKANVGIAMGITGSEITKKAADIILIDDNFMTIKKAIIEGRNIFNNIKKTILFLLSCNIGEILVILLNTCFGQFIFNYNFNILNSLQILWINLVTDSFVSIGLSFEPEEKNLINKKPFLIKNSILNKKIILKIISEGFMIGLLTFLAAWIGYKINRENNQYGQTYAFMVLSLSQLVHVFNLRNLKKSIFSLKSNNYLRVCFVISCFLQISIFFIPITYTYFQLSYLFLKDIIIIILLSLLPLIFIEILKFLKFYKFKKN
jgi:Ca2+-transporting ATPase